MSFNKKGLSKEGRKRLKEFMALPPGKCEKCDQEVKMKKHNAAGMEGVEIIASGICKHCGHRTWLMQGNKASSIRFANAVRGVNAGFITP